MEVRAKSINPHGRIEQNACVGQIVSARAADGLRLVEKRIFAVKRSDIAEQPRGLVVCILVVVLRGGGVCLRRQAKNRVFGALRRPSRRRIEIGRIGVAVVVRI